MIEAQYYERLDEQKVRCRLCPHDCLIRPGHVGICFIRGNEKGRLRAHSYGRVSGIHLDPIEKKPLHFFHPGAIILSVGSIGCNLGCRFCQNWQIAQPRDLIKRGIIAAEGPADAVERLTEPLAVDQLVRLAEEHRERGNIGVAFTYNEPLIWFEYVLEAARALKDRGLKTVLVTNGYVNEAPLKELLPFIDAMNIDIKGFSDDFYRQAGGRLEPVLRTAELAKGACHVEITNLLIPGLNTDQAQIKGLVDWIADTLGPETPLHLSRYFPARRFEAGSTSLADLENARRLAATRLKSVILGNV